MPIARRLRRVSASASSTGMSVGASRIELAVGLSSVTSDTLWRRVLIMAAGSAVKTAGGNTVDDLTSSAPRLLRRIGRGIAGVLEFINLRDGLRGSGRAKRRSGRRTQ